MSANTNDDSTATLSDTEPIETSTDASANGERTDGRKWAQDVTGGEVAAVAAEATK